MKAVPLLKRKLYSVGNRGVKVYIIICWPIYNIYVPLV